MKKIVLIFLLLIVVESNAQNSTDALRYSKQSYLGTARFAGMGSSFGALGGDISSVMINPAGVGVYRNSEFTFSTSFLFNSNKSVYRGDANTEDNFNFNIPNIGYVGTYKGDANGWKNISFAISHNRLNNFSSESRYSGKSLNNGSIIDNYVDDLNFDGASYLDAEDYFYPFGPSEAYMIFLIDTSNSNSFFRNTPSPSEINQSRTVSTKGNHSETFFAVGGNYQDRLYLGGSIGFQSVRFEQETEFTERYTYNPPANAGEWIPVSYTEDHTLITSGLGVNLKIGAIYRFSNQLRLGASIHTPTFFSLSEEFDYKANSRFSDGSQYESETTTSSYDYNLRTPLRLIGSAAYVFKKVALINFDYEYVNYSSARLNDNEEFEYDFSNANNGIKNDLQAAHKVRAGIEYKLQPIILRGGVNYESNPYSNKLSLNPDESRLTFTTGVGFRQQNFNIDFAYLNSITDEIDPVYFGSAPVESEKKSHNFIVSFGWRW